MVLDLAKAFERVSLPVVCGPGRRISIFPGRFCGCHAGTSSTSSVLSLKDAWRSRSRPSRPFSQDPKWSCLLLRVLQDALIEVMKVCPPPEAEGFRG